MKQLKALLSPTQAFINILVCAAVFYLNKDQGKSPLLPTKLKSQLQGWGVAGQKFVQQYRLDAKVFNRFVELLDKQQATDELDDLCGDMVDSFKSRYRGIEQDVSINTDQLQMLKDGIQWMSNGSDSALTRIRRNMNKVGVATDLMEEFRQDTESQAPYLKALRPVVKKLCGVDGEMVPLEMIKEVRERALQKMPKVWAEYLQMRKAVSAIYKNELVNLVRDNGGKPVDVTKARKHMEGQKIKHQIPPGFVGMIGEDGQLYTSSGTRIDGVPQYPVKMNPAFDPKANDGAGNGNVFTVTLPTKGADGKPNVQHFYTTKYRRDKTSQKFELVNVLIKNKDKIRKKWLQDMRSINNEVRVPATMVEISFLTCARIGTPGNNNAAGLSTLLVGNLRKQGPSRILDYFGKDKVHQKHKIDPVSNENRQIIKLLDELTKDEDGEPKKRSDRLFVLDGKSYSASVVRQYWKRVTGMDIGIHKIRTLRGTSLATDVLTQLKQDLATKRVINQQVVDREFKAAITKVGELLGHVRGVGTNQKVTWSTASESYIDPEVQQEFYKSFADKGVRIPKFLQKKLRQD